LNVSTAEPGRYVPITLFAAMVFMGGFERMGAIKIASSTLRNSVARGLVRNIVIVGAGEEGQRLIAKLQRLRDKSIAIRGVFDDRKSRFRRSALGLNILDTSDDLVRVARRAPVEEAIIALPLGAEERLESLFWKSEGIAASSQSPKPSRFAELRRHCAGAQNHRSSLQALGYRLFYRGAAAAPYWDRLNLLYQELMA
jgi:FlaA1/EpsC-like NDP-sugar epimerase